MINKIEQFFQLKAFQKPCLNQTKDRLEVKTPFKKFVMYSNFFELYLTNNFVKNLKQIANNSLKVHIHMLLIGNTNFKKYFSRDLRRFLALGDSVSSQTAHEHPMGVQRS